MKESKKWYESKAVWGGIVSAAVLAINSFTGYTIGEDLVPVLKEHVLQIIGAGAGLFAVYGRVKAEKKIK